MRIINTCWGIGGPRAAVISRFGTCSQPLLRKNLRGKTENFRGGIVTGITREAGFYAGFFEEPLAGPFPFRGDLRKQKSPEGPACHQESMPARDNRFGQNAFRLGQDRDFDFHSCDLVGANRRETRIVQRRIDRGTGDNVRERAGILDLPHASAQNSAAIYGDKCSHAFGKRCGVRWKIEDAFFEDGACNCAPGNPYQRQPIVTGQSGHPEHSCAAREFSGDAAASRCRRRGPKTFENIETRKRPRCPRPATKATRRAAGLSCALPPGSPRKRRSLAEPFSFSRALKRES